MNEKMTKVEALIARSKAAQAQFAFSNPGAGRRSGTCHLQSGL